MRTARLSTDICKESETLAKLLNNTIGHINYSSSFWLQRTDGSPYRLPVRHSTAFTFKKKLIYLEYSLLFVQPTRTTIDSVSILRFEIYFECIRRLRS